MSVLVQGEYALVPLIGNYLYFCLMKNTVISICVLFVFILSACPSLRHLDELSRIAEEAYEADDKSEALSAYERLIAAQRELDKAVDGEVYRRAGLLAWDLGETGKAIEYLEFARHSSVVDAKTYAALAKAYREIDNLSREITMLENYVEKYPDDDEYKIMQHRLFETLVESLNFQQAYELWPELTEYPEKDENLMTGYLLVLRALELETKATDLAVDILKINKNNEEALDWLAKRHFREAEERYQKEMQAYEQNRTHRQYAQLLEALEIVNTDLRIALDYFKRLWKLSPDSEYASYLANIYERFQDDERARYYRQRVTN